MADFGRITIVGVGLIGGALGLALKRRALARQVVGVGHRDISLKRAEERGAIDRWTLDIAEGAAEADIVVICTPVGLTAEKAAEALRAMKPGSILTDVASTKANITRKVEAVLPEGIAFVPAHPMAGSEKRGVQNARPDLFDGARCVLTPTDKTASDAVETIRKMWQALGASVQMLDIDEHDRAVAQISHLPHVIAVTTINAADEASLPYAATGLKDVTRIAASDVDLWLDVLKDNRENVMEALERFAGEFDSIRALLKSRQWDDLREALERACRRRTSLESGAGGAERQTEN